MVHYQDAQPAAGAVQLGDTWYRPSYKDWYRANAVGGSWVKLLGNIASFDQVSAGQIAVSELSAITANLGTLYSANSSGNTTITGAQTIVRNPSNVMVFRSGTW